MAKITISKTQIEIEGITYNWITYDDLPDDNKKAIIDELPEKGKILKCEMRDTEYGQVILIYVNYRNGYITRLVPVELTSGHNDMISLMESIDMDTDNIYKLENRMIEYIPRINIDGKTKEQRKTEDGKRILTFKLKGYGNIKTIGPSKKDFGGTDFDVVECGICNQKIPKDAFKKHVEKH